jgi:hypothetical protein
MFGVHCTGSKWLSDKYYYVDAGQSSFPIKYEHVDIPGGRRIDISYTNTLKQAVCLTPEQWPTSGVMIDAFQAPIALVIEGHRFQMALINGDYCPGCALLVQPGETVRASLSYDGFHIPDALVREPKQLEFTPMGFLCTLRP